MAGAVAKLAASFGKQHTSTRTGGGETVADVKIEIRENGPNRVTGPIDIVDSNGDNYTIPEGRWVSLCRCGLSAEKPFCDGAHRDAGFEAESKAR